MLFHMGVMMAAFIGVAVFHSAKIDNKTLESVESPGTVEAEIVQTDQHNRGSATLEGDGNFLSWDVNGYASFTEDAGRFSVVVPINGVDRYLDLEVSQSRLLEMRDNESNKLPLNVKYKPCYVDAIAEPRICYQLTRHDTGEMLETSGAFQASMPDFKTDWTVGPDEYHSGWWIAPGGWGAEEEKARFNGYLSEGKTAEILSEAYKQYQ